MPPEITNMRTIPKLLLFCLHKLLPTLLSCHERVLPPAAKHVQTGLYCFCPFKCVVMSACMYMYVHSNMYNMPSTEGMNADALRCSDGFYLDMENGSAGVCIPDCGTWEEFPHHVIAVSDAFAITQAVVYIISATLLLVIACFEHKRM